MRLWYFLILPGALCARQQVKGSQDAVNTSVPSRPSMDDNLVGQLTNLDQVYGVDPIASNIDRDVDGDTFNPQQMIRLPTVSPTLDQLDTLTIDRR